MRNALVVIDGPDFWPVGNSEVMSVALGPGKR